MDTDRIFPLLSLLLIPLGVVGLALALFLGDNILAGLFVVGAALGAVGYWALPRLPTVTDDDFEADLTSDATLAGASLQLLAFAVEFALFGYLASSSGLVTLDSLTLVPDSTALALLGVLPGLFLGAGVPYLVQRRVLFHRLNQSYGRRLVGTGLTLGTYLVFLLAVPAAVLAFVATYLSSRIAVLAVGWLRSRL